MIWTTGEGGGVFFVGGGGRGGQAAGKTTLEGRGKRREVAEETAGRGSICRPTDWPRR
jgi:hypothetical protein